MSHLALVLLSVTGLFGVLLVIKQLFGRLKFCSICLAVSFTWFVMLILLWFDVFNNQIIVALLMGQSSLGLYYLLERHAPKRFLVFRLPVLMSLILIAYFAVTQKLDLDALLIVTSLWLVTSLLYVYRTNTSLKGKVKALIECCSDW